LVRLRRVSHEAGVWFVGSVRREVGLRAALRLPRRLGARLLDGVIQPI
jgi:putative aminopeptidase FrvX